MFTSVVGTLTSLLPRYFVFASYVPVLLFSFVNFALIYVFSAWSRSGIEFWLGRSTVLTVAVLIAGTVVIAYVMAAINDFLREFLEGEHVWPQGLQQALCDEQRRRRAGFQERYGKARAQRFLLADAVEGWEQQLRDASTGGAVRAPAPVPAGGDLLTNLRAAVETGALGKHLDDALPPDDFNKLFDSIASAVAQMSLVIATSRATAFAALESTRRDLLALVSEVVNSLAQVEYATATALYTRFGNDPVKPTRMGNVAAAIEAYALGRYNMELTVFFSRLQTTLVKNDDKGYSLVLDAKTQLDFLVACCWLSGATGLVWSVLLAGLGGSLWAYGTIAIVGTLVTIAFYFLASQNYLSYAEVVRACIDVNRFSLLNELAVRLPGSLREERAIWSTMSQLAFSGGDTTEFSYEHPTAK